MATPENKFGVLKSLGLSGWKVSTDVSMVSYYLAVFFIAGVALVYTQERGGKPFTAVLWALACFTVGATIGFLFGIPRVLQQDATPAPPSNAGVAPGATSALTYNLRVNTNLEQISDWLTKIFVGLGLVELQRVPDHLNRAATFIAFGLTNGSKFFAGSLIVYFSLLGFLGFYLITRLYIAGALSRADQEASQKREDMRRVENIDVRLDARGPALSQTERKAAINLASEPVKSGTAQNELAARAKALLSLNAYADAADVYRQLLNVMPNDPKVRFEYAVCLFYLGNLQEAYQQMLQAYSLLNSTSDPKLKRDIYRSLTFQALYQPPPKGFEDAIKFGDEYVHDGQNIQEPAIWTNLAAAYGQRATWLAVQAPGDKQAFDEARRRAFDAASKAIEFGELWRDRIRELLLKDAPNKDPQDNDLEIFERDGEFRRLVGLAD